MKNMASENPIRRKEKDANADNRDSDFTDPFDFEARFAELGRIMQGSFEDVLSRGLSDPSKGAVYYGYTYSVGPDGKPHFKEFGNIKPAGRGLVQLSRREAFVDTVVDEKEKVAKVIVEMPGVQKEDINLEVDANSLKIRAVRGERKYDTTVPLSVPVEANFAEANYLNGILEVKLKLKDLQNPNGVKIKVD